MKVIQVIPKLDLAGAEIMCENLCIALKNKGVDVIIVSLYNCNTVISKRLQKQGINVVFLDKHPGIDLGLVKELYKIFKIEKPDIVHTHINALQYAAIAAVLSHVKVCVHTVHSVAEKEATPLRQKIYYILYNFFNIIPVALSNEVKKSIIKRYDLSEKEVPVVYNGINLNHCIPKMIYTVENELVFLHIGRFADVKNHKMLINAFNRVRSVIPDVKLKLIGCGLNYDQVKLQVEQLNLGKNVEFLGLQSDVFSFLHDADVFILPSVYEGMPMTLIEAMGTGIPIIASNVGAIPSMLNDMEDALLIDVSEDAIVDAMIKMRNVALRKKLGVSAKRRSLLFSAEVMADEYIKIYGNRYQ